MVEIRRQRRLVSSAFRWDLIVKGILEAYYRRGMGGSMRLVFSKRINARINTLPIGKGEKGKERKMGAVEIGREGREEGKGRRTGKF